MQNLIIKMTQVTSLETSLEARKLGVEQGTSEKAWIKPAGEKDYRLCFKLLNKDYLDIKTEVIYSTSGDDVSDVVDARSLDEWLEILPSVIEGELTKSGYKYWWNLVLIKHSNKFYEFGYTDEDVGGDKNILIFKGDENPSEAAGLLWIWLAKNGYVKIEPQRNATVSKEGK